MPILAMPSTPWSRDFNEMRAVLAQLYAMWSDDPDERGDDWEEAFDALMQRGDAVLTRMWQRQMRRT